jgi:tRNA-N(6)-(isopentenyl)adenosine-37 thiotransferase enzyme MiaB
MIRNIAKFKLLNRTLTNYPKCFFSSKIDLDHVPRLDEFLKNQTQTQSNNEMINTIPEKSYLDISNLEKSAIQAPKKFYVETYGCQMNESDTEIVNSILQNAGYIPTKLFSEAQIVLLNTCAIRENAESKVWNRLNEIKALKTKGKDQMIVGVLGCMAERLKDILVEKNKAVDIIVGPDGYRDLPRLINAIQPSESSYGINVQLSMDETYADITPVRTNQEKNSAFVSIMRGCNNMCSFCIVPFTRGRERSRPIESIVDEVKQLRDGGIKEITLLGQNVNSYFDTSDPTQTTQHQNAEGFKEMYKLRRGGGARFADLLDRVAVEAPDVRFRFTSPHPKDFPDPVLDVIAAHRNLCKSIHIPAQSGNNNVLERMRRNYTREAYLNLIDTIRTKIPEVSLSSDFICGFCGETEAEFEDTLSLMEQVKYDQAFLFAYSMREKTHAHRNYQDDVPEETKKIRLEKMIEVFHKNQGIRANMEINRYHLILLETKGKVGNQLKGRTDTNKMCVIENTTKIPALESIDPFKIAREGQVLDLSNDEKATETLQKGDYVLVKVNKASIKTLFCTPIAKVNDVNRFFEISNNKPYLTF